MSSEFSVLYPSMKIIYVLGDRHQHAFGVEVLLATTHELSKGSIFFPKCESSFCLNAPVDSELYAFFTCDPIQTFFTLPLEFSGNCELFESLFFRDLPVLTFQAPSSVWASCVLTSFVLPHMFIFAGLLFYSLLLAVSPVSKFIQEYSMYS